jgi:hypothetical protein
MPVALKDLEYTFFVVSSKQLIGKDHLENSSLILNLPKSFILIFKLSNIGECHLDF